MVTVWLSLAPFCIASSAEDFLPSAENLTVSSRSVMLKSCTFAVNLSPGAAKRGSAISAVTSRPICAVVSAPPEAEAVAATAIIRAFPENSGMSNSTSHLPPESERPIFTRESILKRRACTGLRLDFIAMPSSIPPPPAVRSGVDDFSGVMSAP